MYPNGGIGTGGCRETASGVYCLEAGKGIMRSNVYFVQSGTSWVLVDTASANCGPLIKKAAESLFGAGARPASILLTHDHPDHAGSAVELARMWRCRVYVHPDEMPLAAHGDLATLRKYANPLDRWMVLPLLRVMPRRRVEAMLSKSSLKDVVQELDPTALPGLADWQCVPTPGHTPGHVALFRGSDGVLITGDALVTVNLNSFLGVLRWSLRSNKERVSGPPWYSTWNKRMAQESVAALAALQPRVVAPGHGAPVAGARAARPLRVLADRFVAPHR